MTCDRTHPHGLSHHNAFPVLYLLRLLRLGLGDLLLLHQGAALCPPPLSLRPPVPRLRRRRAAYDPLLLPFPGQSGDLLLCVGGGHDGLGVLRGLAPGGHDPYQILGLQQHSLQYQGTRLPAGQSALGRPVLCGSLSDPPAGGPDDGPDHPLAPLYPVRRQLHPAAGRRRHHRSEAGPGDQGPGPAPDRRGRAAPPALPGPCRPQRQPGGGWGPAPGPAGGRPRQPAPRRRGAAGSPDGQLQRPAEAGRAAEPPLPQALRPYDLPALQPGGCPGLRPALAGDPAHGQSPEAGREKGQPHWGRRSPSKRQSRKKPHVRWKRSSGRVVFLFPPLGALQGAQKISGTKSPFPGTRSTAASASQKGAFVRERLLTGWRPGSGCRRWRAGPPPSGRSPCRP